MTLLRGLFCTFRVKRRMAVTGGYAHVEASCGWVNPVANHHKNTKEKVT